MARLTRLLRSQLSFLVTLVLFLWIEEVVDVLFLGGRLDLYGIRPRSVDGLWGVVFSPFLHGGLAHLAANTVPLLVLGWLVLLRGTAVFVGVFVASMGTGGLGCWLLGASDSVHIGISGVIFGFFGFLVLAGIFERRLGSLVVTVLVIAAYGGLIFGVLPGQAGVSWQSHLFGFLGGAMSARLRGATNAG